MTSLLTDQSILGLILEDRKLYPMPTKRKYQIKQLDTCMFKTPNKLLFHRPSNGLVLSCNCLICITLRERFDIYRTIGGLCDVYFEMFAGCHSLHQADFEKVASQRSATHIQAVTWRDRIF